MLRKIRKDEIELIKFIKEHVDKEWFALTPWEKSFTEDMINNFDKYQDEMLISAKQVGKLLSVSEKIG